jgi:threonylcarbamoyladenosine tRNA methylthiotransferase MtaB
MAELLTFGCRLNAHESALMASLADGAGAADALIVNTCAVTAEAEAQARQAIRKAARAEPGRRIIVTGCAAQIAPEAWAALPGVARVLGNAEKLEAATWARLDQPAPVPDIMQARAVAAPPVSGAEGRTRAFLAVQQGCDHRCTFCIIPYGRGPSRSVPAGLVVQRARELVAAGHAEIVLTGVDIASWGADLPGRPRLGGLARRVLALVPGLARLRLSSLDPAGMDEELWRLVAEEPRFMPHLHLSIQHGAALILKRMKRRHDRADVIALARRARRLRPDIVLGADLIAGFPTETAAHHAETLSLIEEAGLTWLHVFPYSARPGTPAARMPAVPVPVRRERAAALREAGRDAARRFLASRIGAAEIVLMERGDRGRSAHYAPVRLPGGGIAPGHLARLRVVAHDDDGLIAETL